MAKAKAKFHLERRKDKSGVKIKTNIPIRLSFFFNGNRLEYYTQERVSNIQNVVFEGDPGRKKLKVKKVDPTKVREAVAGVSANEPEAGRINQKLKLMARAVESLYDDAIALKQKPTVEYLRAKLDEQFKGKGEVASKKMVKDAYQEYIDFNKKEMAHATYKKVKVTEGHISDYVGKRYNKLSFDDVTNAFGDGFKKYLIGLDHANNTVTKYTRSFVSFLSWCKEEKQKYYSGDVKIKGSENTIDVIYLNEAEVEQLRLTKLTTESLERVRDIFVFGCYVGMRYGDIFNLKKSDVKDDHITFYILKGKKTTSQRVPLVSQSKSILAKYKDISGDFALPVLTNQKMNDYLKDVMKEAKFTEIVTVATQKGTGEIVTSAHQKWELISCHTSRKSFITIAISNGIPEAVIKSITGHSKNSRAFSRYYEIPEVTKHAAMDKVFNKKVKPDTPTL